MTRGSTHRSVGLAVLVLSLALLGVAGVANAEPGSRNVRYRGYLVTIPRSWPVYNVARDPGECVRFDRHALYLGTPGADQRCPAHAAGRTEAILIEPTPTSSPRAAGRRVGPFSGAGGQATSFVVPRDGVLVTATWSGGEQSLARALHRGSLPVIRGGPSAERAARSPLSPRAAHSASTVYNGLGFDACSTPSQQQMSAWGSSPYRAIGVYIGGVNAACAEPNLTSTWVSTQIASGWHLILTYVGLQAPNNNCGCGSITPSQASAEGAAAANDAVSDAVAIGIPAGNPIYDDMEGYTRGSKNSPAVLSFLSAWTSQLHADGYVSGVYSSSGSGITDLVGQYGTGYVEPDDIWIADWNGQQTTSDSSVPAGDWSNQQRLHQYNGAHNEKYGGVTINIDNDYLDGATADTSSGQPPPLPSTPPSLTLTPLANGTIDAYASWSGAYGVSSWRLLAGLGSPGKPLTAVAHAASKSAVTRIAVRSAAPYFAVQALGSGGQVLGTSATTALPPHVSVFASSTFAPAKAALAALPAGCYTGAACHVKLTLSAGRTLIARTGSEYIGAGNGGLLYYRLTGKGHTLLARARSNRLPVQATVRDASGATASTKLDMIAVSTSGPGPVRHIVQAPTLRIVNAIDYVSSSGVGGVLAGCRNTVVCQITTTLKVRGVVIAHTGGEYVGANELGELIFSLTSRGRALLEHATGNQLGAQLTITDAGASATARIVLIRFK